MTPSIYQSNIYAAVGSMALASVAATSVNAVAGSGKTTTAVGSLEHIPSHMKVMFCAFNKHIATEMQRRVPSNVAARTLNSFGNGIIASQSMYRPKLNADKTRDICRQLMTGGEFTKWSSFACKVVGLLKGSLQSPTSESIIGFADHHDLDIPDMDQFVSLVGTVFEAGLKQEDVIDFDDQLFLPIHRDYPIPHTDFTFVDEAQDLNRVQMELVKRSSDRVVIIGDPYQAIYGFRGADTEAMPRFAKELNAVELPLSVCYRCSKAVVKEAKWLVPHIEHSPNAADGIVDGMKTAAFRKAATPSDFVLCRTTAPLVESCLQFIRDGIGATVKGRDIGKSLIDFTHKVSRNNLYMATKEFYDTLRKYEADETARLMRVNREQMVQVLQDKVETLTVLAERNDTVAGIIYSINQIFTDNSTGIVHCTIHRSKGLEVERAFILRKDLLPHPMAKKAHQKQQEKNLHYVAITRAKKELYYVN